MSMTTREILDAARRVAEPWHVMEDGRDDGIWLVRGLPDAPFGAFGEEFICRFDSRYAAWRPSLSAEERAAAILQMREDVRNLVDEIKWLRSCKFQDSITAADVIPTRRLEEIDALVATTKLVTANVYRQAIGDLLKFTRAQSARIRTCYDLIGDLREDLYVNGVPAYERGLAEALTVLMRQASDVAVKSGESSASLISLKALAERLETFIFPRLPVRFSEAEQALRHCVDAVDAFLDTNNVVDRARLIDAIDAARPLLEGRS